jgi:palmitoyl-protein thioesterase
MSTAVPTAVFHGLGDACIYPGMHGFTEELATGTGAFAKCVEVGNGTITSFADSMANQATKACEAINSIEEFQGEFNVVGLSQGGLLARSVATMCEMKGTVRNFLSIGGPQMGVAKLPHCFNGEICKVVNHEVRGNAYRKIAQNHIGPAGYFRDPMHMDEYLDGSCFLAAANNEVGDDATKKSVKDKFSALNAAMLVMFTEDTMVWPKESEWF